VEAEKHVKRVGKKTAHNLLNGEAGANRHRAEEGQPRDTIVRSRETDEQPDRAPDARDQQIRDTARERARTLTDYERLLLLRAIPHERQPIALADRQLPPRVTRPACSKRWHTIQRNETIAGLHRVRRRTSRIDVCHEPFIAAALLLLILDVALRRIDFATLLGTAKPWPGAAAHS